MRLSEVQTREIFEATGSFVREACNGCGQALGAVCYAIAGDPRAWCSPECREANLPPGWRRPKAPDGNGQLAFVGMAQCRECGRDLVGRRAGAEYCDDRCSKAFRRKHPGRA